VDLKFPALVAPKLNSVYLRVDGVSQYLDSEDYVLLLRWWWREPGKESGNKVYEFLTHSGKIGTLTTGSGLGYYFRAVPVPKDV
jgi:hypothetical protein